MSGRLGVVGEFCDGARRYHFTETSSERSMDECIFQLDEGMEKVQF